MHENRETSEPSAPRSGADRPEKADSRMTGTHGAEESDCAVVPVNEPNKEESLRSDFSAEAGEGRAWTEENISQAHTNPTQGGKKGDDGLVLEFAQSERRLVASVAHRPVAARPLLEHLHQHRHGAVRST
jgi:hypothetical protein